jgi:hypothetical protein
MAVLLEAAQLARGLPAPGGHGDVGLPVVEVTGHVSVLRGGVQIQGHDLQQLVVTHLREQHVRAAFEQVVRELSPSTDERIDSLFNPAATQELVHEHVLRVADAERAIGAVTSRNCVKTSALSCFAAMTSAH